MARIILNKTQNSNLLMRNYVVIFTLILAMFYGCYNNENKYIEERDKVFSLIVGYDILFKFDSIFQIHPSLNGNIRKELLVEYVNSFDTIFTLEDKKFMIRQFLTNSSNSINNELLYSLDVDVCKDIKLCKNILYLTIPMITKDKRHSMSYVSLRKGKDLENWILIHRNDNESWKLIGMKPVSSRLPN